MNDVIEGTLIGESLRANSSVDGLALTVRRIRRGGPAGIPAAQRAAGIPATWTLVDFEVPASEGQRLAAALAGALDDVGWYVDFRSADETFVVFAGRVFRYRRGDASGRSEAQAHARTKGVPVSQVDWPE